MAIVASTGRARVSSTFSFLSGFVDFTILIPALAAVARAGGQGPPPAPLRPGRHAGHGSGRPDVRLARLRRLGRRRFSAITIWTAGLFFTRDRPPRADRRHRRGVLVVVRVPRRDHRRPEPLREHGGDDRSLRRDSRRCCRRSRSLTLDYPMLGIGTGMQQNARVSLRHLYEVGRGRRRSRATWSSSGPIGFMLIWTAKLGLMVALFRAYTILKRAGRRGSAGAALSYCVPDDDGKPGLRSRLAGAVLHRLRLHPGRGHGGDDGGRRPPPTRPATGSADTRGDRLTTAQSSASSRPSTMRGQERCSA